jgi:hypothetical protein
MTRYLMTQWAAAQWQGDEAAGYSGEPLAETASDASQFAQLQAGDRVYVVGQRDRKMILIARMNVGQVVSQSEAEAYFGGPVFEAKYHVIASEYSVRRFDRAVPEAVVRSLVSERGAKVAFASARSYELMRTALMPRFWLTEASARALDRVLGDDLVVSDGARELMADTKRGSRVGQGRRLSAAEMRAVERQAMVMATEHFRKQGWAVKDVSTQGPYDLECTRNAQVLAVEVKGTIEPTIGEVLVTRNEVKLAQSQRVDYAVVAAITLAGSGNRVRARGGTLTVYEALAPKPGDLTPLAYSMRLPHQAG